MEGKIRYSVREAQAALGIKSSKFWKEVRAGKLSVYYDGPRAFCTPETLKAYDLACQANKQPPATHMPRSRPGTKGVQRPTSA